MHQDNSNLQRLRKRLRESSFFGRINNQRGIAMMLALSTVALIIFLAVEVSYDSSIEYNVNSQELNRVKAYYAARGALELGLLRIKLYRTVKSKLGDMAKGNPYIEKVWTFPLQWPLPIAAFGTLDKDEATEKTEDSLMDAQYTLDIADEGSKIDVNDLNSPSETVRKNTEKILKALFDDKLKNDDEFRKDYGNFRFDDLIDNIKDFMTSKSAATNGGDKRAGYSDFQTTELPPNRGFRTIGELHMVPLMDDVLFDFLSPRITIFGLKAVNPNTATLAALESLDGGIDKKVAQEIDDQRQKKPFDSPQDFYNFVSSKSQKLTARSADALPLTMDTLTSFKITAVGSYAGVSRTIIAIVADTASTANRIKQFVDKEKAQNNPDPATPGAATPGGKASAPQKQAETVSKGPPRVVYYYEQ